tara:strand:- start:138 stop:761 length:624 start_codon:yes stop_codon:yes gene_type:complete
MENIDTKYQRGQIYTVRCRYDDTKIYVGSTIQPLAVRMAGHRQAKNRHATTLYKAVDNDWDNWYIELYEDYPCNNKNILLRREGQVIREIGTINKGIAGRTNKEWSEDNKEKRSEQAKERYANNKEKINTNNKEWYANNKEKRLEKSKEWYENNKEKQSAKSKEWRENNKEKLKQKAVCDICGSEVTRCNMLQHKRSKKCLNYSVLD